MSLNAPLVVVDSRPLLLGSEILVETNVGASFVLDSFLGKRRFFLAAGSRLRIKVKGKTWPTGYRLTLLELIFAARDWNRIPWRWA
jgi:hypothetical protein